MAAPRSSVSIYRNLMKELKRVHKNQVDSPAQVYVKDQFRKFQVTGEKECRGRLDVHHTAETYLCLLQSQRKYDELQHMYKGSGERDAESSAKIVGLKLPTTYNPDAEPAK